jgi:hypothetical protein
MGLLVPKPLLFLRDNILKKGSLLALPKAKWANDLNLPKEGEYLLFGGCGYQYLNVAKTFSPIGQRMEGLGLDLERGLRFFKWFSPFLRFFLNGRNPLRSALKVLSQEGIEVSYLGEEEPCCGGPLYFSGFRKDFLENLSSKRDFLSNRKKIIGMVPSCCYALKELWGLKDLVEPFPIFWLKNKKKKRRLKEPLKVTYHDPCILSRYLGVVEEVREILRDIEGLTLVEAEASGEWANCCGGGGGFELVFPYVSKELAKRRAEELLSTGAQLIVTACPGCLINLEEGVKALGKRVRVLDLLELLEETEVVA